MASPKIPNDIILFHYPFSPYARRIVWYLTLRNIPYAQCLQPPPPPRPDLAALGVSYRRIPLCSIGGSIYADTRAILSALERLFPASASHPPLSSASTAGISALLSSFTIDGGVFTRAAQLLPTHLPIMQDPRFAADRTDFTGAKFSPTTLDRVRPEAEAHMRRLWDVYETLLSDGRTWIGSADATSPGLADIEGVWPLDWMGELGSLPKELFGPEAYPKTTAWAARFKGAVKEARKRNPEAAKAVTVKGDVAFDFITSAKRAVVGVDAKDPTGLKEGQEVMVWPIDTGFNHKDKGRLVGLDKEEVVIAVKTKKDPSKEVLLHAPRLGFRVVPTSAAKL
ncbi:hypothetical protein K461DRAFT_310393 [Myriangium duriaei CBS 260.36]|uniref:GST N-terminal domain-containing protein n=1 Tax=Myriangium duriaei CBS 260.36 TaxID=1168546 RepID=A0A9P4J642_9PEZI|nr:hypothetical protein K461DRAFT_310393 [Myriangium duriaei CBS 260.36]